MGLEPMTSPLPRECSTTELHQPVLHQAMHSLPRTEVSEHHPKGKKAEQDPRQGAVPAGLHGEKSGNGDERKDGKRDQQSP